MSSNWVVPGIISVFEEAADELEQQRRGTLATLHQLFERVEFFAHFTDSESVLKISVTLRIFYAVAENALENYLTDNYVVKIRHVRVPDPDGPDKTREEDMSDKLSWIAFAYPDLTSFFGERSEAFRFQRVKQKLVDEYVDDDNLPFVAQALIASFEVSVAALREPVLEMLGLVIERLSGEPDVEGATEVLWHYLLRLRREHGL